MDHYYKKCIFKMIYSQFRAHVPINFDINYPITFASVFVVNYEGRVVMMCYNYMHIYKCTVNNTFENNMNVGEYNTK